MVVVVVVDVVALIEVVEVLTVAEMVVVTVLGKERFSRSCSTDNLGGQLRPRHLHGGGSDGGQHKGRAVGAPSLQRRDLVPRARDGAGAVVGVAAVGGDYDDRRRGQHGQRGVDGEPHREGLYWS